jgi:hypothetical protein
VLLWNSRFGILLRFLVLRYLGDVEVGEYGFRGCLNYRGELFEHSRGNFYVFRL